jgi:hypothetical protein
MFKGFTSIPATHLGGLGRSPTVGFLSHRLVQAAAFTASLYSYKSCASVTTSIIRTEFAIPLSRYFATMASSYELPEGFLEGPAPNIKRSNVNFTKGGLPGHEGKWAVVLDGVLTEEECEQLVAAAEATTDGVWERAMVNIGGGRQAMYEDTRKCGRIIWDTPEIMAKLWARIEDKVPDIHRLDNWPSVTGNGPAKWNEVWKVTRLNDRARFLKYVGGEYFKGRQDVSLSATRPNSNSALRRHL